MSRREVERDRDRLAPEVGGRCNGMRVAPPGVADEMLAGDSKTGERLDIARVVGERGEEPALRLRRQLRRDPTLDRRRRPRETLIDPELAAGRHHCTAARLLQNEEVKLSGDLAGNLGLDRFKIFRIKLIPICPAVFRRHRVGDLHVDPERRRAAALSAPGNDVFDFWIACPRRDVGRPPLFCDPRERQPAAVVQEVGDEIVSKGFHQVLLAVVACQIAHRRDSHRNIRQHTRPFWPRFFGDRR